MNRRTAVLPQSRVVLVIFPAPSVAEDEEALKKDLTMVIAPRGLPCGEVVAVEQKAESDFVVSCKDEPLYRMYLRRQGGWWNCGSRVE